MSRPARRALIRQRASPSSRALVILASSYAVGLLLSALVQSQGTFKLYYNHYKCQAIIFDITILDRDTRDEKLWPQLQT